MKTSLTMLGFILFFTGTILLLSGVAVMMLEQELITLIVKVVIGVIALKLGRHILNKCATYRGNGPRRRHITHRLAR